MLKSGVTLAILDQKNPTPALSTGIQELLAEQWNLAVMLGQGAVIDSDRSHALQVQLRQAIQAYARELNTTKSKEKYE